MSSMMSLKPYPYLFGGFFWFPGGKGHLNKHPEYPPYPTLWFVSTPRSNLSCRSSILLPRLYLAITIQCISVAIAVEVLHAKIVLSPGEFAPVRFCIISICTHRHRHYWYSRFAHNALRGPTCSMAASLVRWYCAPSANHRHHASSPCSREHGGVDPKSTLP